MQPFIPAAEIVPLASETAHHAMVGDQAFINIDNSSIIKKIHA